MYISFEKQQCRMLVVFPPNFGMDARIIYGYNLVAPLRHILGYIWIILLCLSTKFQFNENIFCVTKEILTAYISSQSLCSYMPRVQNCLKELPLLMNNYFTKIRPRSLRFGLFSQLIPIHTKPVGPTQTVLLYLPMKLINKEETMLILGLFIHEIIGRT